MEILNLWEEEKWIEQKAQKKQEKRNLKDSKPSPSVKNQININGLNLLEECQVDFFENPTVCCLPERDTPKEKNKEWLKVKG